MIPDFPFKLPEKTFTTVAGLYPSLLPGGLDEFHEAAKALVIELKLRILRSSADRKHSKETPALKPQRNQIFLELRQLSVITIVHASDDIEFDRWLIGQNPYRL